jgi:hypothetical protein
MPSQLTSPEQESFAAVPLAPAAAALLADLKADLGGQSFSEQELAEINGALERFSAGDAVDQDGKSTNQYRDTVYQDRYQDTAYDDHYKDNVGYRDAAR